MGRYGKLTLSYASYEHGINPCQAFCYHRKGKDRKFLPPAVDTCPVPPPPPPLPPPAEKKEHNKMFVYTVELQWLVSVTHRARSGGLINREIYFNFL